MVTLDCPDPKALASFYSEVAGGEIGIESGQMVGVQMPHGLWLGFQRVDGFRPPQWPEQQVPQQFHLDILVDDLDAAEAFVTDRGATKFEHQPGERNRIYADPAGHPFCLCPRS